MERERRLPHDSQAPHDLEHPPQRHGVHIGPRANA
jgi:hypothetical protein